MVNVFRKVLMPQVGSFYFGCGVNVIHPRGEVRKRPAFELAFAQVKEKYLDRQHLRSSCRLCRLFPTEMFTQPKTVTSCGFQIGAAIRTEPESCCMQGRRNPRSHTESVIRKATLFSQYRCLHHDRSMK